MHLSFSSLRTSSLHRKSTLIHTAVTVTMLFPSSVVTKLRQYDIFIYICKCLTSSTTCIYVIEIAAYAFIHRNVCDTYSNAYGLGKSKTLKTVHTTEYR